MQPRIEILQAKKLIGKSLTMSLINDKTFELWSSFMPERSKIKNAVSKDLYSLQVYDVSMEFKDFTPQTIFTKWALVEVTGFDEVPDGMLPFTLAGGMYTVWDYKGLPKDFPKTFHYIFNEWMPKSMYEVDKRPHFELLGEKYRHNDPASEEEIWVPVRVRE